MRRMTILSLALFASIVLFSTQAIAGAVLDEIKADGKIICLVNPNSPGFSTGRCQERCRFF